MKYVHIVVATPPFSNDSQGVEAPAGRRINQLTGEFS